MNIGAIKHKLRYWFGTTQERQRMDLKKTWRRVDGDRTLRLQYPLRQDSVVVDVGGYHGQWTSDMYAMYRCRVHIFEPIPKFADIIEQRFVSNPDITLHRIALGSEDGEAIFKDAQDSTGRHAISGLQGWETKVPMHAAAAYFIDHGITHINLMKINIEGDEYDLLEHFASAGIMSNIEHIQIQFHSFVADADRCLQRSYDILQKTHTPMYQFRYIWESWKRT